jgi:hypothetical protein
MPLALVLHNSVAGRAAPATTLLAFPTERARRWRNSQPLGAGVACSPSPLRRTGRAGLLVLLPTSAAKTAPRSTRVRLPLNGPGDRGAPLALAKLASGAPEAPQIR